VRRHLRLGLLALLALVSVLALAAGSANRSGASFTTTSQSAVTASADTISRWIHLWSQGTDPSHLTGYATQRVQSGTAPLCATGSDQALVYNVGGIRRATAYTFSRAFTLEGIIPFPDSGITTVNVDYSLIADAATGRQPISSVTFTSVNGSSSKYGVNVLLNAPTASFAVGNTYTPKIRLTMTFTGSPTTYYIYDVPVSVTIVTW